MDFHLKQWRSQQQQGESEPNQQQQRQESPVSANAAKMPKLLFDSPSLYSVSAAATTTTLPLFVPEEGGGGGQQKRLGEEEEEEEEEEAAAHHLTNLASAFHSSSDHHSVPCRFPRNNSSSSMGSYFSWAQWQELELQALIYRYMMAGAAVPPELLQPIKKSLLLQYSSPYFLHSRFPPPQYPPSAALLHAGYWGRSAMDPEPGRCRRTDGKKWRCSRDVVSGQKYCERHMHRGRNRSRKPVEIPTPAAGIPKTVGPVTAGIAHLSSAMAGGGGSHYSLLGSSPASPSIDLIHLNQSYSSEVKAESRGGFFGAQNQADSRPDGHILRPFFDDWPRPLPESDNAGGTANSSACLSISDVSLKLSTGNGDEPSRNPHRDHPPPMSNWAAGWGSNQVTSMGGPLAEVLRSSSATDHSSPTSILYHLPRGLVSEASYVST